MIVWVKQKVNSDGKKVVETTTEGCGCCSRVRVETSIEQLEEDYNEIMEMACKIREAIDYLREEEKPKIESGVCGC